MLAVVWQKAVHNNKKLKYRAYALFCSELCAISHAPYLVSCRPPDRGVPPADLQCSIWLLAYFRTPLELSELSHRNIFPSSAALLRLDLIFIDCNNLLSELMKTIVTQSPEDLWSAPAAAAIKILKPPAPQVCKSG